MTEKGSRAMLIMTILASVALAAVAQITLKHGMDQVAGVVGKEAAAAATFRQATLTAAVWLGLVLFGLSALVWLMVLKSTDLSFAYPFASLTYVIIVGYEALWKHGSVPGLRWAGVGFIVAGIVLVSRGPTS
jgi:drug/metabolite transporter (DMT)-like permease